MPCRKRYKETKKIVQKEIQYSSDIRKGLSIKVCFKKRLKSFYLGGGDCQGAAYLH